MLRQQRENFLPLKVIKDRLDDGSAETGSGTRAAAAQAPATSDRTHGDAGSVDDGRHGDPVLVGQRVGAETESRSHPVGSHPTGEVPLTLVGEGSALPGIGSTGEGGHEEGSSDDPVKRGPSSPTRTRGPIGLALASVGPTGRRCSNWWTMARPQVRGERQNRPGAQASRATPTAPSTHRTGRAGEAILVPDLALPR